MRHQLLISEIRSDRCEGSIEKALPSNLRVSAGETSATADELLTVVESAEYEVTASDTQGE